MKNLITWWEKKIDYTNGDYIMICLVLVTVVILFVIVMGGVAYINDKVDVLIK